ncbi:uncharacterized protein HD556DRAFT_1433411 [Suillus plorans]|uniref:Uncharacterized protein n=1 Tax=Suillus plorans TaxID=116603 RepID=A0A9P7AKP3_9AGAM|nr:uncharacterized protein HD556DRAFT_1433411 [Suillus plorans]KAG1790332.1 hypothetical protein HD556DRAFT_1433411 [Suillus plorans]
MLLCNQLSNPDFKDGFDHASCQVYSNNHERVFSDFMSGNWAWNQYNGAIFVPVILGSDKITMSITTGNNEYYPLYISKGNVHNNIRCTHINAVSLAILSSLRPTMTTPEVPLCSDGHYCCAIHELRPYIADYPKQCLLSCIVQGWCLRCTASKRDLDKKNAGHLRTHEFTELLRDMYTWKVLWDNWGIVNDIMPFIASFPRANIHELLSPNLLHQVIKVSAAPSFPGLRRFPEGQHFKQWTGNDSKALMKVFLPAITGLVPDQMANLDALDNALAWFHKEHNIFIDSSVMPDGISLPRQHALMYYQTLIQLYGAPNSLCSLITESKHIKAIKKPWRRSNHHLPLGQMLLINQRLNKLAAFKFLNPASLEPADIDQGDFEDPNDKFDPEEARFRNDSNLEDVEPDTELTRIQASVELAQTRVMEYPHQLPEIAVFINCLNLPELVGRFLYDQCNPNASIQAADIVDVSVLPVIEERVDVFNSAVATFRAPSDIYPSLSGFQGLYVAQVILFFSITYCGQLYPCALVCWFTPIGNEPCKPTGMWMVEPELDDNSGERLVSVIHLDSIMCAAHLIGVYGSQDIPHHLKHTDSLVAFLAYNVNKFSDYHAYEIAY